MRNWVMAILVIVISMFIALGVYDYLSTQYNRIETQRDTVVITAPDYSLMKQNDSLCLEIDSLNNKIKILNEELFISNFKLERIKEYNRIAGNGNNITFLRGWINRVLNE